MRKSLYLLIFYLMSNPLFAQTKVIHVFVALCDNEFQGIVPVPDAIGNGKDPGRNLYWGAGYGVKNFFDRKTTDWQLMDVLPSDDPKVLDRRLFKSTTHDAYLLAEAYDGEMIKDCIEDFFKACNRHLERTVSNNDGQLAFGGDADLVVYVGHDGLMDFDIENAYHASIDPPDAIMLACYTKEYFGPELRKSGAYPLLWTTHLMAPEAYTLKSAIDGWLLDETGEQIEERAAQTYNQYQHCGIKGARNLFTTGW